ncbi:TolC family protein [Natronospora cellulosivora (SeqCode)]
MKNKILNEFIIICLLVLVFSSMISANQEPNFLVLEESIRIALDYNLDISIARIDFEQAETNYQRYIIVADEELIEEARENLEHYQKELEKRKLNIAASVEERYFNLLRSQEQLEITKRQLERVREQLEADELKYEVGLISELSIEASREGYNTQKVALRDQERSLETAHMQFNSLIGCTLDSKFILSAGNESIETEKIKTDFDKDLKIALEEREDINNLRERVLDLEKEYQSVNNIYSAKVDIERAENNIRKEEIRLKQLEENIFFQIRKQIFALEKAWEGIDNAEKEIARRLTELEAASLRYEAGVISTRQMLDHQENLAEAENNLVQSKWDYNLVVKDYYKALGIDKLNIYIQEDDNK